MCGRGKKTRTETSAGTIQDYMDRGLTGSMKGQPQKSRGALSKLSLGGIENWPSDLNPPQEDPKLAPGVKPWLELHKPNQIIISQLCHSSFTDSGSSPTP